MESGVGEDGCFIQKAFGVKSEEDHTEIINNLSGILETDEPFESNSK